MKKLLISIGILFIALIGVLYFFINQLPKQNQEQPAVQTDYKNITYIIDGQAVTLGNGATRYFGNEAEGDLNSDGISDIAFLLTQDNGGSGTFYYVVAGLKTDTGYQGTNAVLLGDRIAPQNTQIQGGVIIVNYAVRAPGEPMTEPPSNGISKYLEVKGQTLNEIVK